MLLSPVPACLPASPDDEDVLEVDADDGDEVGRSVGETVECAECGECVG